MENYTQELIKFAENAGLRGVKNMCAGKLIEKFARGGLELPESLKALAESAVAEMNKSNSEYFHAKRPQTLGQRVAANKKRFG